METKNKNKYKGYFGTFLNIAAGAGAVVGGAYILSRIKEKQDTEIRLERMEQIIDKVSSPEELKEKD